MRSWFPNSRCFLLLPVALLTLSSSLIAQQIPRTSDGKPDLQGIWQAETRAGYDLEAHAAREGMPAGESVVEGGTIPYQDGARAQKIENYQSRATSDPVGMCFLPGVPRIMYMDHPFQIFQTADHVAMTFEWMLVHRLVYLSDPILYEGVESWMGDSRGRWEGDTLVVDVTGQNGRTWFDMAGNYHSDQVHVTERYTMLDPDTIQYQATIEDPQVFTEPWTIQVPLVRQEHMSRLMEYQCSSEEEEFSNDFERDPRLWYPEPGSPPSPLGEPGPFNANIEALPDPEIAADVRRLADGKPDLTGYYSANSGGANYGLEQHERDFLTPGTRGVVVQPADGTLPYRDWARQERIERELPHRGYDDPTAHCFVAGVPRSHYTPSPYQLLQPPGYVVFLFERMAWRIIPLDGRDHISDSIRLWQGDSVGHWEGDVLVVETTNLNGKTWLNEVGDVVSHMQTVVERFIPIGVDQLLYRATVTDPIPYSAPWTIEMQLNRGDDQLLEVACREDNVDLEHLKDVRDEYRAQQAEEN